MALDQTAQRTARAAKANKQSLSHCATASSSNGLLLDSRQSPRNAEVENPNKDAPLMGDVPNYHSIVAGDKNSTAQNEGGDRTRNSQTIQRKRSTTILIVKPSPWSTRWRNFLGFTLRRSNEKNKKGECLGLEKCKFSRITRVMAFGVVAFFILIVGAYLLGRLFAECPSNKFSDNRSSISIARLLRDRLASSRKSISPIRSTPVVRLRRDVIPLHYDAQFDLTDLHNRRIRGTVRVSIECAVSTDSFVFHASHKHLSISKLSISKSDTRQTLRRLSWNQTDQSSGGDGFSTISVTLDKNLVRGMRYEMTIVYNAIICNEKSGVNCYEEVQRGQSGHVGFYVSTKFEPTAARTLMPCFDEPEMKTTFNVTIVRHSDTLVITNTPLWRRTRTRHGQVLDHFETSPKMSTYLLGIVAGSYVRQERRTDRGTKVTIWTRREDRSKGEYPLEYATSMLRVMEHYFSINYPLSKLDLVASPNYPVGAMENWGLLIFHQRALLYTDEYRLIGGKNVEGSQTYQPHLLPKFHVSKIITHELVHQWFGNLVTMRWWSEIWLNEGFATFFIYHFLKGDFPLLVDFHQTWKLVDAWQRQTAVSWLHQEFTAQNFTLVRNFTSDAEIYEAFDEHNLYAKGGSVVRMLWHLLGENAMQTGLIRYLTENQYRSVDRWELWKYIEYAVPGASETSNSSSRSSLGTTMESWLTNPGFPEVKISRTVVQQGRQTKTVFTLEQNMADVRLHCAYVPIDSVLNQTKDLIWSIPLSYTIESSSQNPDALQGQTFWMISRSQSHFESSIASDQWFLANPDFQFPYRVNYDLDNWSKLINQLRRQPDLVPMRSRVQLLVDASFFLQENENLPYFLDLLGYLRKETELLPLILGIREAHSILDQYKASSIYPFLIFYFRPIVEQATEIRTLSENEPEQDAVWWLDDSFTLKLKILQCVTRHKKCHISREEVQSVLSLPSNGQLTDKLIPICEYLRRNFSNVEREILLYWLQQQELNQEKPSSWSWRQDIVFMVTCVHERALMRKLIDVALARGDLEFLATSLSSTFTLSYNEFLITELWSRLGNATVGKFSDDSSVQTHLQTMLHSVRTLGELELAKRALSALESGLSAEISFMESRLTWQEQNTPTLEEWLMEKLELS